MKPLQVRADSVGALIERAGRESGAGQYIRELFQNALEAGAARIDIGPEWVCVEAGGPYRFMIADNGCGMTPDQLETYLGSFAAGGKAIGGIHENFGIGAKTSTLPWNHRGVVIISYTAETPDGVMLWLEYDAASGQYGMKELSEDGDVVADPFDGTGDPDVEGIDWRQVAPEWVREHHGTVVVLLGNTGTENTLFGRDGEDSLRAVRKYINTRYWRIPEGVEVKITELHGLDKLPKTREEAFTRPEKGWKPANTIAAHGAAQFAETDLKAEGILPLSDGTRVRWYLRREKPKDGGGARFSTGFVAAVYKNELYNVARQGVGRVFRAWGISHPSVYERVVLLVEPKPATNGKGVFPSQARASLLMQRADDSTDLPWDEWREEFRDKMPEEIARELAAASKKTNNASNERLQELEKRMKERYAHASFQLDPEGTTGTTGTTGTGPRCPTRNRTGRKSARKNTSALTGEKAAKPSDNGTTSIPDLEWVSADVLGEEMEHHGAVWTEPSAGNPRGLIQANEEFRPLVSLIQDLQKLWHASYADLIREVVLEEVKVALQAKVAEFRAVLPEHDPRWKAHAIREMLGNSGVLTFAMVGFTHEHEVIKRRLISDLGKARHLRSA